MFNRKLKKTTNRYKVAVQRKNQLLDSDVLTVQKSIDNAKVEQNIFDVGLVINLDSEVEESPELDIKGDRVSYKRIPNLRDVGRKLEAMPSWMILHWICKHDIRFFAENFFYINTIDFGKVKIQLREFQIQSLQAMAGENITHKLKYYDPDAWDSDERTEYDVNFLNTQYLVLSASRQSGKCQKWNTNIIVRNKRNKQIKKLTFINLFVILYLKQLTKYINIKTKGLLNEIKKLQKLWK